MTERRDPAERAAGDGRDLYDVATWERRTLLDRIAAVVYAVLVWSGKGLLVLLALALLAVQFVAGGLVSAVLDPEFVTLVVLSVVPALLLAGYVWYADATERQPLGALAVTFVLGVLFAMFAAVVNRVAFEPFEGVTLVLPLLFFLVVGPVEETVKLAAVRLYAYGTDEFASVVDGAVYGAVAGLGFATIENLLYISRSLGDAGDAALLGAAGGTAAVRALAGPGHVIYSAFAGYYLGLARFNPENRGPIVVKGLLIAAFVHGAYNTLVGIVPSVLHSQVPSVSLFGWFVLFIVVYDGVFGLLLYRKLRRYADVLESASSQDRPVTGTGPSTVDAAARAGGPLDGAADRGDGAAGGRDADEETRGDGAAGGGDADEETSGGGRF